MQRRWNILKYYACGHIPNKGHKLYVKLTTKGFEDIQCTATEKNQMILPGMLSSKLLMKHILQKGKGVKLGTYPGLWTIKNY